MIGSVHATDQPPQVIARTVSGQQAIDAADRVWWTDASGAVRVAVPDETGHFSEVELRAPGGVGPVRVVRPARDGTRIALLVGAADAMSLLVGAVVDDAERGLEIGNLMAVGDGPVLDASWHDSQVLGVIDQERGVIRRIDLLGAHRMTFAIPAHTVTLTDAPSDPVVLRLADGSAGGSIVIACSTSSPPSSRATSRNSDERGSGRGRRRARNP